MAIITNELHPFWQQVAKARKYFACNGTLGIDRCLFEIDLIRDKVESGYKCNICGHINSKQELWLLRDPIEGDKEYIKPVKTDCYIQISLFEE